MIEEEKLKEKIKQHKTIFVDGYGRLRLNENKTKIRFLDDCYTIGSFARWVLFYDENNEDFTYFDFENLYELKGIYQVCTDENGKRKVWVETLTEKEAEEYKEHFAKRQHREFYVRQIGGQNEKTN